VVDVPHISQNCICNRRVRGLRKLKLMRLVVVVRGRGYANVPTFGLWPHHAQSYQGLAAPLYIRLNASFNAPLKSCALSMGYEGCVGPM
jgi:hypothetical protein